MQMRLRSYRFVASSGTQRYIQEAICLRLTCILPRQICFDTRNSGGFLLHMVHLGMELLGGIILSIYVGISLFSSCSVSRILIP